MKNGSKQQIFAKFSGKELGPGSTPPTVRPQTLFILSSEARLQSLFFIDPKRSI
jgi:hypothetical protein